MSEDTGRRNLRMPNSDQMFALVTEHLGGNHVRLQCEDGETRMGRIPGRMKFRTWINEDDIVLAEPWDWQDEKANVEWRYDGQDADQLRSEGHLDSLTA
ncbi:translation initiation factor 1A 2 [Halobacteriales archaeon QS_6_64_34]|nr:MAG: translation initiation factor 1A 2 [Halobacteriales archaeon QS_6_64_34]